MAFLKIPLSVPTVRAAVFVITGRGLRKPMMSWQNSFLRPAFCSGWIQPIRKAVTNLLDQFGQGKRISCWNSDDCQERIFKCDPSRCAQCRYGLNLPDFRSSEIPALNSGGWSCRSERKRLGKVLNQSFNPQALCHSFAKDQDLKAFMPKWVSDANSATIYYFYGITLSQERRRGCPNVPMRS